MNAALDCTPDTPRTDALAAQHLAELDRPLRVADHKIELWNLARQLERELTVAKGLEQMAYEQRNKSFDAQSAYKRSYKYLQDRLESLGYHGWAHDMDGEIDRCPK